MGGCGSAVHRLHAPEMDFGGSSIPCPCFLSAMSMSMHVAPICNHSRTNISILLFCKLTILLQLTCSVSLANNLCILVFSSVKWIASIQIKCRMPNAIAISDKRQILLHETYLYQTIPVVYLKSKLYWASYIFIC